MFACAAAARADGPDEPDAELRLLSRADEFATSACVGKPGTPTCAVETYEACLLRNDASLCDAVDRDLAEDRSAGAAPPADSVLFLYRLVGQRVIYPDDIPAARGVGPRAWRDGDIALLAQWHACGPKPQCVRSRMDSPVEKLVAACPPAQCTVLRPNLRVSGEKTVVVRRAGDRWIVVDATYDQVLPNAIWGR